MIEETSNQSDTEIEGDAVEQLTEADERAMLMQRARMMNVKFSNNIATDKLRARVAAAMEGQTASEEEDEPEEVVDVNPLASTSAASTTKPVSFRKRIRDENMRLIRVRITNLDPKKADLPGEVITFSNEVLGTVRKFIPYDDTSDEGYHIENCLYKLLKSRKFAQIQTKKDKRTGRPVTSVRHVPEFNLEVLKPLTKLELENLANEQRASAD